VGQGSLGRKGFHLDDCKLFRSPLLQQADCQMPSLPLHLANLSQLLQTRLQLYQPLLSLSGRLDLASAQIQIRQQAALQSEHFKGEGERYVEGESDDEVEIETGDGEGEVEDVDMRDIGSDEGESEDEDEDDSDDDEEEDEDLLDSDAGSEQGFLDFEAEEDGSEDEEDSEED
jgi:U3 small nucleolar RNA-associated protein 5